MKAAPLSNFLADLAERTGEAFRRGQARTIEAAAAYLDCGRLLAEAKRAAGHGQWLPFLARAGVPERTARRMMRLYRSGIDAETLAAQGVRAALAGMGRPGKSVTVTDLPPPAVPANPDAAPDQARAPTLYQQRREAGVCVECGDPSDGLARCPKCRAIVSIRGKRRRALARTGEVLAPRLAEAAAAGTGLRLSAAEVLGLARSREGD